MAVAHPEPYTVEELFSLPDDGMRHELLDGTLLVSPPPNTRHQAVVVRLRDLLAPALPAGMVAAENVGLRCGPDRLFVPDLVVVPFTALTAGAPWLPANHALLVVEVASPSSVAIDAITKPAVYAEAGIPLFLRVVTDGPRGTEVHAYALAPGTAAYASAGSATAGQTITLPEPLVVSFDPTALTR